MTATARSTVAASGDRRPLPGHLAAPPPWLAILVGVLAWAAALAAIEPVVHGYLTDPPDQRMVDLAVYRTGGLSVLRGEPVYSILTQPPQMLPFTYPPLAAVLATPLAMMPWSAAQLVWTTLIYLPLTVVVGYAFRPLLQRAGRLAPAVWAGVFCAGAYLFPMRDEMRFGQVDILLAALCVADCLAARPRWPRGALVGLATAIKLMPGIFLIYLWVTGQRRAARTAALSAAGWTAGAFLVVPTDSVTYWTSLIFNTGRLGNNAGTENQSLRGLLLRFFLPGRMPEELWLLLALAVAAAGFTVVRRLSRDGCATAAVAVTALLEVLVSPVAWIHDFVVVVIALGALVGDGRVVRRVAASCGAAVFYFFTVPWWGAALLSVPGVPKPVSRIVQGGFGLAALALLVVIARMRRTGADRTVGHVSGPSPSGGAVPATRGAASAPTSGTATQDDPSRGDVAFPRDAGMMTLWPSVAPTWGRKGRSPRPPSA